MDLCHDLGIAALLFFAAYVAYDWANYWWTRRRHGFGYRDLDFWKKQYLGHKVWTWLVRVAAWGLALWQLCLALVWTVQLLAELAS